MVKKLDFENAELNIQLIHDVDILHAMSDYTEDLENLFYSLIIEDTDKPIFECCREYMKYLCLLQNTIDLQIEITLDDMELCHPADDEED